MAENCVFCKIIAGLLPADIVYRDEHVTAFKDRSPAAPTHLLVVPNRHIPSLNHIQEEDAALLGKLIIVAQKLADQEEIVQSGYRLLFNTGKDAGQTVFHVHLHLLGGRRLPGFTQ